MMRFVKGFSLFFLLPVSCFLLGFYSGIKFDDFFYPGEKEEEYQNVANQPEEKLHADTILVIEKIDLTSEVTTEETKLLPTKYLGMTREAFLDAMEQYNLSPPLQELEQGFTGLNVLAFSEERVKVSATYEKEELPEKSFYLMTRDHYVTVYCEDKTTLYLQTDIILEDLPEKLQLEIICGKYMENEQSLYNFLESYSS